VSNRSRVLACLGALGLATACAAPGGVVWATGAGSRTPDGLQRVRWSDLGALFLRPGAQLQAYHRVLLEPAKISPATAEEEHRDFAPTPSYPPTTEYLVGMQGVYREAFAQELGRHGFELVTAPGPGVLRLSGYVIDLVLTAPVNPQDQPRTGELIHSFGEFTLVLVLGDAASGTPLLRAINRESIAMDPAMGGAVNSQGANLGAQRQVFDREAQLLVARLQALQQDPALPPAP
jgi:hypothetical protein